MKRLVARALLIAGLASLPGIAQTSEDGRRRIATLEQQVQKHLQERKPELAIPLLREIVSLDPKNVNAQANAGVLLFFQGNYAEAIPRMHAALELQPNLSRIEALLGIAERRTGDPRQAQQHLEHAFPNLDDRKIQIQAGLELVDLYSGSTELEKAASVASKLEAMEPQNAQILLIAYQIARQRMNQSLLSMMIAAPDSAEMHMIMAGELGRQGDRTAAIAHYRDAIRLNPALRGAHFELAEQLRTSPDPAQNAEAEEEYRAAIRVNQYDATSWRQLAGIRAAKGDFKVAEEHYRKALALQPKDSEAKTGLAIVLNSQGKTNDAIALLEGAARDDPTSLAAHYRLSLLYRRAGRNAEADRELETFRHYQDVRGKLEKIFKQLAGPNQGDVKSP